MRANQLFAVLLGVAATLLASQPLARAGGADGPAGLGPLAAKALVDAHRSTGLAVPDDPPPVLLIPTDALAGLVCAGRCRGVGAYLPGQGILLDRELDPAGNVRGRALLLHELVLYALERGQADPELA